MDAKTIYGGSAWYQGTQRATEDQSGAVAQRASRVDSDYRRHARHLDDVYSRRVPGTTPVLDRLMGFGEVRGAVFGQYAEASEVVHSVLDAAATGMAQRRWRAMGARTETEARGFFIAQVRRRMGLRIAIEMARHRLHRVRYIGLTRADLMAVRDGADGRRAGPQPIPEVPAVDFFAFQAHQAHPGDVVVVGA